MVQAKEGSKAEKPREECSGSRCFQEEGAVSAGPRVVSSGGWGFGIRGLGSSPQSATPEKPEGAGRVGPGSSWLLTGISRLRTQVRKGVAPRDRLLEGGLANGDKGAEVSAGEPAGSGDRGSCDRSGCPGVGRECTSLRKWGGPHVGGLRRKAWLSRGLLPPAPLQGLPGRPSPPFWKWCPEKPGSSWRESPG